MVPEKKSYDISYCTVSMNRAEHVKKTLTENIENNLSSNVEFLLLDYNSKDDLEIWTMNNMKHHIKSGKLKFFKTNEPTHFDRSHSRNMIIKQAKGKYVCNVDADNYLGKGFSEYVIKIFSENNNCYLGTDLDGVHYNLMDTYGRVCCEKSVFMTLRGYDESLKGYGPEDKDFFSRLENIGISKVTIKNTKFLRAIAHSNTERICNEFLSKQLKDIYICHVNPERSIVLITLFNKTYNLFEIEPNKYKSVIVANLVENSFQEGKILIDKDESIILQSEKNQQVLSRVSSLEYRLNGTTIIFKKNTDVKFKQKALIDIPLIMNQAKMQKNILKNRNIVNELGFGEGSLIKNFGEKFNVYQ